MPFVQHDENKGGQNAFASSHRIEIGSFVTDAEGSRYRMENNQEKEKFSYVYSAKEQAEITRIRKKYVPTEDKMEQLRRLDAGVTEKATAVSIIVGLIGALILGVGMCCAMVWQGMWFITGIIIGLIGIAVLAGAYPIYQKVIPKEREKIAPEIIRLTDELLK